VITLGIWDGHDAGAALVVGSKLAAAVNEERFTRRKLEVCFPRASIEACLAIGGVNPGDIDIIATSTTDVAKAIGRCCPSTKEKYYAIRRRKTAPGSVASFVKRGKYWVTEWSPNRLSVRVSQMMIRRELGKCGLSGPPVKIYDHHHCHAVCAALGSGMARCLVITIDGVGDGASASVNAFEDGRLRRLATTPAKYSLGVFFEHVTNLLNMRELEDEGKVMALADYAGRVDDHENPLLTLIRAEDMRFISASAGHAMLSRLKRHLWFYPNEQFAFMAQRAVEVAVSNLVRQSVAATGIRSVALAGGVASNVKANREVRLLEEVDDVYVFPHMGDGGLAVGAAACAGLEHGERVDLRLEDLGLGPEFSIDRMRGALDRSSVRYLQSSSPADDAALLIANGSIILWFEGRMEYGPRALGHRSVLARPDRPELRDRLNLLLKRRVWYQPFCPSILESDARVAFADWKGDPNRHMTMAYSVGAKWRAALAGVTNIDGSCRPQIVRDHAAGAFADLLRAVRLRLGLGAVLNTSFNIHGEPLVNTPEEAVDVFRRCGADALVLGPYLVERASTMVSGASP
jgi:carbamoyltransferase